MNRRQLILSVVTVGLALGTAWAVRGRFGHEQGAAWAGAIGALSLILVAKRKDWYQKTFKIAMAAAFGWGISGVMSYGILVGYGRGTDFLNVYYGLLMLFVLGLLYGFLGGGFVGLALLNSKENRVPWYSILAEMIALAILTYSVLIDQLGWLMTPPRSEAWAACLGASIALGWYIIRQQYYSVLRVAIWSAVGAGFGFAFGNFLQVIGAASGIKFNFWNVMEYSIGFFGGVGMAYATFTSPWPQSNEETSKGGNLLPILFTSLFVPFVVWDQSFTTEHLEFITEQGGSESVIFLFKLLAILMPLTITAYLIKQNYTPGLSKRMEHITRYYFILYTGAYIVLSFLITGLWKHPVEQFLYVANYLAILYLLPRTDGGFSVYEFKLRPWVKAMLISIAIIAGLALIAINSHDGLWGRHERFPVSSKN